MYMSKICFTFPFFRICPKAQAALKKEMELYALENEAALSEVIEDLSDDEGYASSVLSDDSQEDLIPETTPPAPDESPEEQRDRVKKERLERRKYRHRRRREKAQRELRKRRERHEAEQAAVLEAFRKDALIAHAKAELEWMELEEEARVIEKQAFRARANLRKVALYCQGKGMDELRARSKAIYYRKECTEKTLARDRAAQWLEVGARVDIIIFASTASERVVEPSTPSMRRVPRYLGTAALVSAQTRTRPPSNTRDLTPTARDPRFDL